MRRGGAEQVVLSMLKAFPTADLYTLCYDPENAYSEYKNYKVKTSAFQYIAKNANWMKMLFFPFGIWAMKAMDVKGYDVVLISTTFAAKYVNIDSQAKVFIYVYTPFRLAWNPTSYTQYNDSKGLKKLLFDWIIKYLKKADAKSAQKGDYFLGMTSETAERIREAYKVEEVTIIKPDVKCRNFYISDKPKNYYLLVSRLEFYKKVDLAIEAFNDLGLKLIVVGNGTKSEELKAIAKENIEFKKGLSAPELAELYANCKAFIFPQHEDYGITPLEANAAGRPVIAYGKGGVLDTMIPYTDDATKATALFFQEQKPEDLISAVLKFEQLSFDPAYIRKHAESFDEKVFISRIQNFITEKYRLGTPKVR
ncbi:MAG: glycosyltransferase [Sphingobacteriaceae bacterium]|nr:MAG: glycosyltransferase [Sphingobacteriaceae bacterium]